MRTIVHIGQHKTATTSIQMFLKEQSVPLCERGLYVPLPAEIHALLNVYSLDSRRMSPVKDDLKRRKNVFFFWTLGWRIKRKIAQHYRDAKAAGCQDVIWSNEGLYLLNSNDEYNRLVSLFSPYSQNVVAVCSYRDIDSFRKSYILQLEKDRRSISKDPDSYRYVENDSWLFDFDNKKALVRNAFDESFTFSYDQQDNVSRFFETIGYPVVNTIDYRHNETK